MTVPPDEALAEERARMAAPALAAPVPCPTCGAAVAARYCGACGERMLGPRDHSLVAFLGEAFSTLTTLDNRVWRTLRGIPRPGFLTREYVAGRRRRYLGPLQLFLLFSVVFFVASPRLGLSTTRLDGFARSPVIGAVAGPMIEAEVARRGVSRAEFEQRFVRVKQAQERFFIMLTIPVFALVMKLLYRRRSYVEHLAFATHTVGSLLVLMVAYLFAFVVVMMTVRAGLGLPPAWRLSGIAMLLLFGTPVLAFVFAATRRVYEGRVAGTAVRSLLATAGLWASLMSYEYVLFFSTLLALRLGS